MGKQIQFFMIFEDEREFIDYARSTGEVLLFAGTSRGEAPERFNYPHELKGREFGETCYLWNKSISPEPVLEHIWQQNYYCLDFMNSEVISFLRSNIIANEISTGRIHIEDKVLSSDGNALHKSTKFIEWYGTLERWVRSHSKDGPFGARVASGAAYQLANGMTPTGPIM